MVVKVKQALPTDSVMIADKEGSAMMLTVLLIADWALTVAWFLPGVD